MTGRAIARVNLLCTQGVRGSNPLVSTNPIITRVSAADPPPVPAQKAGAHLAGTIEAFLLKRRVSNCTSRTLEVYADNLRRFQRVTGILTLEEIDPLAVQRPGRSKRRGSTRRGGDGHL